MNSFTFLGLCSRGKFEENKTVSKNNEFSLVGGGKKIIFWIIHFSLNFFIKKIENKIF